MISEYSGEDITAGCCHGMRTGIAAFGAIHTGYSRSPIPCRQLAARFAAARQPVIRIPHDP